MKHYRLRFETSTALRYQVQQREDIDILSLLITFTKALGFYTSGPRKLRMETQEELLDDLFAFFVMEGSKYDKHELVLAKEMAKAAFLYDYGGNVWEEYSKLESLYRMCYNVNHNRVRIRAKEAYSCAAMMFDQFLTCSPITPIQWSSIEKMAAPTKSKWSKTKKSSGTLSEKKAGWWHREKSDTQPKMVQSALD